MAETQATLAASDRRLYGPLKAVSEAEAKRQFGAATTIIRPGLIAGPGDDTDRFTYWPVRLARGGEVLAPGDGDDPVQFIDARDLAEWTIRAAEQRTVGVFNATGPAHTLHMGQMLGGVAAGIGANAKLVWVSQAFLDANQVSAWTDMPVWVPRHSDSAGFVRRDISRALAAGLTFRPVGVTAKDALDWFRTQPDARQSKLRAGLSPDREAQLLAQWKAKS
jgi:2'-hydroxyisoflavone reductase